MKFHYNKQSQFELFPGASAQPARKTDSQRVRPQVILSIENLLFLGVAMIISMVVSFSLGVERGKQPGRVAVKTRQEQKAPDRREVRKIEAKPASRIQNLAQQPVEILSANISLPRLVEEAAGNKPEPVATIPERADQAMYTIQVASFQKVKFAQEEAKLLKKKGYEIFVIPKGKYSIVCVGRFAKKDEAKSFSRKLKKTYHDCLVRSL